MPKEKPETIRVQITHSHKFYKSGQKYTVFKQLVAGWFEVASPPLRFINMNHAKQIPKK